MNTPMKFTVDVLLTQGLARPCSNQLKLFERVFPDGAELTVGNVRRALDANLDMTWLIIDWARLTPEVRATFWDDSNVLRVKYMELKRPHRQAYEAAVESLRRARQARFDALDDAFRAQLEALNAQLGRGELTQGEQSERRDALLRERDLGFRRMTEEHAAAFLPVKAKLNAAMAQLTAEHDAELAPILYEALTYLGATS